MPRIQLEMSEETLGIITDLAEKLGATVDDLVRSFVETLSDYSQDIVDWAYQLKVRKEHRVDSVMSELIYYGVATHKNIIDRVLDVLKARGRYELEYLELDPDTGSLEIELVALEGSDLLSDRVRISWGPDGVIVEAYYYLEEDEEAPVKPEIEGFDWAYLPDEHAVLVTATGKSLSDIPPLYEFDNNSGLK